MRAYQRVQSLAKAVRRHLALDIDVGCHRQRMHSGVRPAGSNELRFFASHLLQGFLERLLNGRPVVLALPAHEGGPVILDRQPPARHGRIVPFGIANPRNSSPELIGPRPAR